MSPARPSINFEMIYLPTEYVDKAELKSMLTLYRAFRLRSLRLAPEAFASTYDKEVEFTEDIWLKRLQNKTVQHIIATTALSTRTIDGLTAGYDTPDKASSEVGRATPNLPTRDHVETAITQDTEPREEIERWIGMIVVLEKNEADIASASISPWATVNKQEADQFHALEDNCSVVYYQINGMFVDPDIRRSGLGRRLLSEGLAHIRRSASLKGLHSVRADILVDSWNTAARDLYLSCGFKIVKEEEYTVSGIVRNALVMTQRVETCL